MHKPIIRISRFRLQIVSVLFPISCFLFSSCVLLLVIQGCAGPSPPSPPEGYPRPYKAMGRWYQPVPHARGYKEEGVASWYGTDFHGKKTSSGEAYNMYDMTAAHKILPFDTLVRVTNITNGEHVDVRVNDRGPFAHDRIIDLSYSAAKKLGIIGPGTAEVEIEAIGAAIPSGENPDSLASFQTIDFNRGNFTFQVGAFQDPKNAQRQRETLAEKYANVHITVYDSGEGKYYRVRVGKCTNLEEAIRQEAALMSDGFSDVFIVAE